MKNYLIDLDGTLYRGGEPIEYAAQFIRHLNDTGRKYLLVTNCPLNSQQDTAEKLVGMGIPVTADRVLNCGMACADFLAENRQGKRVFVIGSSALKDTMYRAGVELCEDNAEIVVVGHDTKLTYERLSSACMQILAGAEFIATNLDNVIPFGDSYIPHTGAIVAAITAATGKEPFVIGKPAKYMLDTAQKILGCDKQDCAVIGDRLDTDMAFAVSNGIEGNLVLTGYTTRAMLPAQNPDSFSVYDNLSTLMYSKKEDA